MEEKPKPEGIDPSHTELNGKHWLISFLIAGTVLTVLVFTSPDYGMVWDEGHTVRREILLDKWFQSLYGQPDDLVLKQPFGDQALEKYWPFSRSEPDGHPPGYALVGLVGWELTNAWFDPLTAYRFGPMLLFASTVGALWLFMCSRHGLIAAFISVLVFTFMPRVFSHAHYAHYDIPMACFWVWSIMSFSLALTNWRWSVLFGISMGFAATCKFSGWFVPIGPVAYLCLRELVGNKRNSHLDRGQRLSSEHGIKILIVSGLVAIGILYAVQPYWWQHPIEGPLRFLRSNLTRADTQPQPTLYAGSIYEYALPWHNTIVLTAITTPLSVVLASALGIAISIGKRNRDTDLPIWLLSWSVLMIVRSLPNAPGHDGIRQFIPSILILAVFSGVAVSHLANYFHRKARVVAFGLAATIGLELGWGIASLYPYTLSYYNEPLGGLAAANSRGFELTYYWDTMAAEFREYVVEQSKEREFELRFPSNLVNVPFLRTWGYLPPSVPIEYRDPTRHPDYVLQRRRGLYYPWDKWLEEHGVVSFRVTRQGVDLLRVYSHEQAMKAVEATKHQPIPDYLRHGEIF